jgi:hypothetical protein
VRRGRIRACCCLQAGYSARGPLDPRRSSRSWVGFPKPTPFGPFAVARGRHSVSSLPHSVFHRQRSRGGLPRDVRMRPIAKRASNSKHGTIKAAATTTAAQSSLSEHVTAKRPTESTRGGGGWLWTGMSIKPRTSTIKATRTHSPTTAASLGFPSLRRPSGCIGGGGRSIFPEPSPPTTRTRRRSAPRLHRSPGRHAARSAKVLPQQLPQSRLGRHAPAEHQ